MVILMLSLEASYWLDDLCLVPCRCSDFSLSHYIQPDSGITKTLDAGALFVVIKWAGA
jgi:hypothetical protein